MKLLSTLILFCFYTSLFASIPKKFEVNELCTISEGRYKGAQGKVIKELDSFLKVIPELQKYCHCISGKGYSQLPTTPATDFALCCIPLFQPLVGNQSFFSVIDGKMIFNELFFSLVEMMFREGERFYGIEVEEASKLNPYYDDDKNRDNITIFIYASSWLEKIKL